MKKNDNQEKSRRTLRKFGVLLINFALFYTILRLIITASERLASPWIYYVGTTLYILFGGGCFVAFYVLNGFTFNKEERTIDDLPENWDSDRKMEFLRKQPERKAKAKQLIYIILPMLVTLAVSYVELNFIK